MPLIIGVTGSIAAGKSSLCSHLVSAHDAVHVDADREIHQLYAPGTPGFGRVVAEFGDDIVGPDGVIDRRILGSRVFGNAERMEALRTAIGDIAAHFRKLLAAWRSDLPEDATAVFEAVNLFNNDYMEFCDAAWLVVCERDTAIARMMETRSLAREEAERRLESARDWREQSLISDRIFHNDGSLEEFLKTADSAFEELRGAALEGTLQPTRWALARDRAGGRGP